MTTAQALLKRIDTAFHRIDEQREETRTLADRVMTAELTLWGRDGRNGLKETLRSEIEKASTFRGETREGMKNMELQFTQALAAAMETNRQWNEEIKREIVATRRWSIGASISAIGVAIAAIRYFTGG